jgi:leucyl aminopeptidase
MKYKLENAPLSRIACDLLVVGIFQDETVESVLSGLDGAFANGNLHEFLKEVAATLAYDSFQGKSGQTVILPTYGRIAAKKLVLSGLGLRGEFKPVASRKMAANLARRFASNNAIKSVCIHCRFDAGFPSKKEAGKKTGHARQTSKTRAGAKAGSDGQAHYDKWVKEHSAKDAGLHASALVEGWQLGSYSFHKYKTQNKEGKGEHETDLALSGWHESKTVTHKALQRSQVIAEATNFARGLIAEPALYMTPTRLAEEAKKVAAQSGLTCKVMDAEQAQKLGMGAFLGVARGASEPPRFIVMRYKAAKSKKQIAIVGKGITFDSGGLSLKPAVGMENMKYDMSGAAAVIATMRVVGMLKPDVSVLGLVAATENMPGGKAIHPGDILVAMNGKTIEVNNTDAEGRLVLADAISYACKQEVDEIIDIATLTGAIVTALGRAAAGIMGSDQGLVDRVIKSGAEAGEKLWQMPLYDEYKETLKSDIADLKNAGSRGEAGSSSGGMFLKEFVDGKPWVHMDIAGPGWLDRDRDECNKGGTAFGVRTLSYYILSQS